MTWWARLAARSRRLLSKGFHVPDLGMRIAFLTPEQSASTLGAMPAGAVVMEVESGRPMAKAGIHVGDVVVSIGGKKIGSEDDLRQAIFKIGPGKNSIFVPPQRRYQNRGGRLRKLQS